MPQSDTIAAIATGLPGAIGIVRLSGPKAVEAASALFRPLGGGRLEARQEKNLVYGALLDGGGQVIDWILATYCRGPASYTGEDTVELHCHGSPMVLSLALEALFALGCCQAQAGEFTRRAFLAGKLDLAQAEAVADLMDAASREAVRHSAGQLGGALSRRTGEIYSALVDLAAHFCAVLDYADEEIDPFTAETIFRTLTAQEQALTSLLATWRRGQQVTRGVPCALLGRPNAGKSSLLNALLGYERAIVTSIPGTTRDTIEERCQMGSVTLRLVDTAGLRQSDDPVEQLGVERSLAAMERSGLIFYLWDRTGPFVPEDETALCRAAEHAPVILLCTKCDLPGKRYLPPLPEQIPVVEVSAHTGEGLDVLEQRVEEVFPAPPQETYGELLTNQRQAEGAQRALECLVRAREALGAGFPPDAVLADVEEGMKALGELTGQSIREDVTDRIFRRFCVGK